MSDKRIDLNKEDFSFVCPMKQENMTEIEGGFFCNKCEEKVHDVSGMSVSQYDSLLESKTNVCVTFKKVVITSMAFGLVACSEPKTPKPILMGKIAAPNVCTTKPIAPPKHKLTPFKPIDTNKTVEIAGGIMMPQSQEKKNR